MSSKLWGLFFNKMFEILRGKCQPTLNDIGFMKWIGKLILRAEAQLLWVFKVEYKRSNLSKLEIWRWEGWGQNPGWPEWRNSKDARTHLKMIRGGWWVIGDNKRNFWTWVDGRTHGRMDRPSYGDAVTHLKTTAVYNKKTVFEQFFYLDKV